MSVVKINNKRTLSSEARLWPTTGPTGYSFPAKALTEGKLCKRAGVRPFGFHAIRHAGAALLDQQRIPLGTIQKILGHENRTTTEIYLHNLEGAEREAMKVFENASAVREAGFQEKSLSDGNQRPRLKLVKG
ncbi:MAG: tyrosine-type recombinase/integrase [Desulfarculaceae bacterium]|jgi:integrase